VVVEVLSSHRLRVVTSTAMSDEYVCGVLLVEYPYLIIIEHKTRVWSCYVNGGKIERMYHRVVTEM